jgi:hypothetical protein
MEATRGECWGKTRLSTPHELLYFIIICRNHQRRFLLPHLLAEKFDARTQKALPTLHYTHGHIFFKGGGLPFLRLLLDQFNS